MNAHQSPYNGPYIRADPGNMAATPRHRVPMNGTYQLLTAESGIKPIIRGE
jgi:hypothetical protein